MIDQIHRHPSDTPENLRKVWTIFAVAVKYYVDLG